MKFEEFIGFGKTFSPGRTLDLGAISFDTSVIDEGVVRTPHDEMKHAYRMMNNRPHPPANHLKSLQINGLSNAPISGEILLMAESLV